MASAGFSRVKDNARELVSSSDAIRAQQLLSRDIQDELSYAGAAQASSVGGVVGTMGQPFSGLTQSPTFTGIAGSFSAIVGAARGFDYDPAFAGLGADDSPYQVLRWAQQSLLFGTPDATNPRIDLVVAAPVMVDTDLQFRSVLLDPVLRNTAPLQVFKTSNPQSALTVVPGVPASAPLPPAVPAGTVAVFEVLVPATVTDSVAFQPIQRLFRKALYPASTFNGPLYGCGLQWLSASTIDPTTTNSFMSFDSTQAATRHEIFIDGELIDVKGLRPAVFQDTSANPFGSAAPAGNSVAYYVYACGGRNLPQGARALGSDFVTQSDAFCPLVLVESLTPPNAIGHPTSAITTPRGSTRDGAVYVGLGFVYRNTSNRAPLIMTDGNVFCRVPLEDPSGANPWTVASRPFNQASCTIHFNVTAVGASALASIDFNPSGAGTPAALLGQESLAFNGTGGFVYGRSLKVSGPGAGIAYAITNATFGSQHVMGYSHNVRRVWR